MSAWKKHKAGRRSRRDAHERDDFYEAPGSAAKRNRIERLTRTATALGNRYEPHEIDGHDEDLDAVADELDRLLSERGDSVSRRPARTGAGHAPARDRAPAHDQRLEGVLGALDRLDAQVQGFSKPAPYFEDRHPLSPGHSAGGPLLDRDVMASCRDDEAYPEPEAYFYEENETGGYDDYPHHSRETVRRRRPHMAEREASMHVYKDLGRRIDALRAPQEHALNQVREELGSLRSALGGVSRGTSETAGRQNAELRRLSDMVERLRADKKNDQLAKEIRREVADLKSMVGRTNVEGALQTLEHGYSHILQRLDELSRVSVDPRVLKGVTARLSEIEDAFAALPRSEHMLVLEDRVVTIAERVEELLQHKGYEEIEPLRTELREVRGFVEQIDIKGLVEGIDDRMKFVSGRLDDLEVLAREQRGLDTRLSAMEERIPEPETISRLQGRLEDIVGMMADERAHPADRQQLSQVDQRLNEIVDRLDRMEQAGPLSAPDTGTFNVIEQRLDQICGKIDEIERKASEQGTLAASPGDDRPDNRFLEQIQDRLNDLTDRLDQPQDTVTTSDLDKLRQEIGSMRASVPEAASTEALEQRISDLAHMISKGSGAADDERFEQLGAKVAALAEQIGSTSAGASGVEQFTPVLERIEQGLQQTRHDVEGIAKKAAQEAVANGPAPKNDQYEEAIAGLQGDLKQLLDAAEGSDERTRNTFDGVKSVLGSLTERLDNLERSDTESRSEIRTPASASFAPAETSSPAAGFTRPPQHAPDLEESDSAFSDLDEGRPEMRARDRKADFIAAARRAAQAASAEAAKMDREQNAGSEAGDSDEERGKARVGWLRNVLKRGKTKTETASGEQNEHTDALELGSEDLADGDFDAHEARVLPGDRPAPEASQVSGNRRRAFLFAAAAVILLLGTLQVYRFAAGTPGGDENLASAAQETAQPATALTETANAVPPTETVTALPEGNAGFAINDPGSGNENSSSGTAGPQAHMAEAPRKVSPEADAQTGSTPKAAAVADPAGASAASVDPAASQADLAFGPPVGVATSFGDEKPDDASSFKPSRPDAPVSREMSSGLIASLPPEGIGPIALRSAAASGNPAAEFLVGVKYTEGKDVPADLAKAAAWYQKAADKGLPPAQYRLASLYEKGRGVEKDVPKAKAWYSRAAEAGNAKAMHNLAVLHAEGGGGEPDYAAAARWFEAAANYGVKDSLFNLGILYSGGIGVDKDLTASYKWFAIAANQGDPEAAKRRDDVANMMDQETLANARLAVESFALITPDAAANKVTMEPAWTDSSALPAANASVQSAGNSQMILEAQDKLNYLGFDTGYPDGQMGPRTRSAIRAFQRSLGLPETGEVDARLIEELTSQAI